MGNLASAIDELLAVDPRELPETAVGELIVELRRQANRIDAAYYRLLENFDRRGGAVADAGTTQAWLRQTTNMSPSTASRDVHLARDLTDMLPATAAALADGEISPAHAQVIASLHPTLDADTVRRVEPHLADAARTHTPIDLRRWVAHVRNAYDPDGTDADEQDDYAARRLRASATIRGVGVGDFILPAPMYETLMTAIHALSKPIKGDDRTPAQRRADALVTLAEMALRSGELPVTGGVKPHVSIVIDADALAADSLLAEPFPNAERSPCARRNTGDFGFGGVSGRHWVRRFLCDAAISRIVMSAAGEILDAGRATRTFTAAQVRAIVARDRHCIWPGCDTPAAWCDAHHIHHWADGGVTSVENGALLCGRHHDRVHLYGHAIARIVNGGYTVDLRAGSDARWRGPRNRAGP